MKNWTFPLVAAVVFFALLAYVMWGGSAPSPEEVEAPQAEIEIVTLDREDVKAVTIRWEDTPDLAISAVDGEAERTYQLTSPFERATDQERARLLFTSVAQIKASRIISEGNDDLSEYGLDDPSGAIIVTLANGSEVTLNIGDGSPLSRQDEPDRYVKVAGEDTVYLMTGLRLAFFMAPPDKWRDPVIMRLDSDEVQMIEIRSGTSQWSVARSEDPYGWQLISPIAAPARSRVAEDTLWKMGSIRAERYESDHPTPDQLQEYGLDAPSMRITFTKESGESHAMLVGLFADEQGGQLYVKMEGQPYVYVVNSASLGLSGLMSWSDWLATAVFAPASFRQVVSLQWETEEASHRLVRGDDHWLMELPSGDQVAVPNEDAEPAVRSALAIEASNAKEPDQPLSEYGPTQARLEVNFRPSEDVDVQTLGLDIVVTPEQTSYGLVDGYESLFVFDLDLIQILHQLSQLD